MKRKIVGITALTLLLALIAVGASATSWSDPLAVERQIYTYLTEELKLNSAAACGVLANIEYESNFQPTVVGDNGTSYGLCQWHDGRYTALKTYCTAKGVDYQSVEGQMDYLSYELKSSYTGLFGALRSVENSADGAYRAAYLWCIQFERPEDMEDKAETRGNSAKYKYWNRYNSLSMISTEETYLEPEELIEELQEDQTSIEMPRRVEYVEEPETGRRYVAEKPEKIYYVNLHGPSQESVAGEATGFAVGMLFVTMSDGVDRKWRMPQPEESGDAPDEDKEDAPAEEAQPV